MSLEDLIILNDKIDKLEEENEVLKKGYRDMLDKDQFPQSGYHVDMFIWKAKNVLREVENENQMP